MDIFRHIKREFRSKINVYLLLPQGCWCAKDTEWQFKFPKTGFIRQSVLAAWGMILEEMLQVSYLTALVEAKAVCSMKKKKKSGVKDSLWCSYLEEHSVVVLKTCQEERPKHSEPPSRSGITTLLRQSIILAWIVHEASTTGSVLTLWMHAIKKKKVHDTSRKKTSQVMSQNEWCTVNKLHIKSLFVQKSCADENSCMCWFTVVGQFTGDFLKKRRLISPVIQNQWSIWKLLQFFCSQESRGLDVSAGEAEKKQALFCRARRATDLIDASLIAFAGSLFSCVSSQGGGSSFPHLKCNRQKLAWCSVGKLRGT